MAATTPRKLALLLLFVASPAVMYVAAAAAACAGEGFPAGRTYTTCQDLSQLGAALHWTYDASGPSLSLAFVAAPAAPEGWVAWGINPSGQGMVGTQALLALVAGTRTSPSVPAVRTYNITGYTPVGGTSTPIAFPVTGLAADAGGGGKIRLYGTLKLREGTKVVNQVWQIGSSVTRGAPDMHAMAPENLAAMGKLVLAAGAGASSPPPVNTPVAGGAPSSGNGDGDESSFKPPVIRPFSSAAATASVSATALVVFTLLGFLAMTG